MALWPSQWLLYWCRSLARNFQVFPFFLWPSYPSVSVSAIWRNSGSRVFHMQILDTDNMCFPREMANPFGHVLTRATTIVIILVSTTSCYYTWSVFAMKLQIAFEWSLELMLLALFHLNLGPEKIVLHFNPSHLGEIM